MPWNLNKLFGVIQRDCMASDVSGIDTDEIVGALLKRGTLMEIITEYRGDGCYFKLYGFENWMDKYKNTIYKCSKDDYIAVTKELWPYLFGVEYECRIILVQNVYSRKFDINLLKLNRIIRIRKFNVDTVKYHEFLVTHNGEVKKMGPGYYIGLQFENGHVPLPPDLEYLAKHYQFGGLGIVVTAGWIMLNLYKDEVEDSGAQHVYSALLDISIQKFELSKNIFKIIRRSLSPVKEPNKMRRMSVAPKNKRSLFNTAFIKPQKQLTQPKIIDKSELVTKDLLKSQVTELIDLSGSGEQPPTPIEGTTRKSVAGAISKSQHGSKKNTETSKCGLCTKKIESGHMVILRECLHSFCKQCLSEHIEKNSKNSYICCPHIQIKCQLNLLDVEIRDLVGDVVYNQIRENRLKDSDSSKEANARPCPNANCNNVWISARKIQPNYERCSECKIPWCNLCNNSHEPGEQHGHRIQRSVNIKKRNVDVSKPCLGTCAKCCKPNIQLSDCINLQKCKHSFCNDCIIPMIKSSSSSKIQYAQCIICQKQQQNVKNSEKKDSKTIKLSLNNRDNRPNATSFGDVCCCKPHVPNCFIILKCKHSFCRTRFNNILQKQLRSQSRATCPTCLEEIDDCQQKHLVEQMQSGIGETCGTCSNLADIHLEVCRHSFCISCVRDLISNQASDLSKLSINCVICHDPFTDSDISRYGSKEIFNLFKSKIEAAILISKPVDHIKLTNWLFRCATCKERITIKKEVKLAGSRDCFCLECCKKFIGRELSNSQIPRCPHCRKLPKQFEVDAIIGKHVDAHNNNKIVIECLVCENKFEESLIQKCLQCNKSICLKCAKSTILGQITNNRLPGCPFCQNLLDKSQIISITNASFKLKEDSEINQNILSSQTVEISFNCGLCKQLADNASKIKLNHCKHEICSKCLCGEILNQMNLYMIPQCPLCQEQIDHTQLESLGVLVNYNYAAGIPNATFSLKEKPEKKFSKLMSSNLAKVEIMCIVCDELFDRTSQIVLNNCKHSLCLKCLRDKILDQINLNLTLKCPICLDAVDLNQLEKLGISTQKQLSLEILKTAEECQIVRTVQDFNVPHSEEIMFKCVVCGESHLIPNRTIWSRSPKCPVCKEGIDQIQLDQLRMSTASRKSNSIIFEETTDICSLCNEKCQHKIILKNCEHKFCKQCIQMSVTVQAQQSNGNSARCPICSQVIELNQIAGLQKTLSDSNILPNIYPFECPICSKNIDVGCRIVLTNCGESLCRDCISYAVLQQSAYSVVPNCPMCQTRITDEEIGALNLRIDKNFDGKQRREDEHQLKPNLDVGKLYFCVICEGTFELVATKVLSICKDRFCRQCITATLADQIFINKIPSCPFCCRPVSTTDIIDLCGVENFNRCSK